VEVCTTLERAARIWIWFTRCGFLRAEKRGEEKREEEKGFESTVLTHSRAQRKRVGR
jgi:hypothetical protein